MTEEEFKSEIRALIKRANLNQFAVSVALEEIADEQMAEFDDREEA